MEHENLHCAYVPGVISPEHEFNPEQRLEESGYVGNQVVNPGPMVQLLVEAARSGSQQSTGRTGNTQTKVASDLRTVLNLWTVYSTEVARMSQTF